MIQRNLYPNQLNINKLKENQTKGASGELPPAP
ncbi:replication initiator protein A, partial [Klebsiella oxytoca]